MAPSDYVPLRKYLTFGLCKKSQCVSVDINDDETVEEVESFYLTLEGPPSLANYMVIEPHKTNITIEDNDSK